MSLILLHALSALLYAGLAAYFWRSRWRNHGPVAGRDSSGSKPGFKFWERCLLSGAVVLHALLLAQVTFAQGGFRFGFAHALSLMALLALFFYGVESLAHPLEGMPALVLPPAAISVMLPIVFEGASLVTKVQEPAFIAHILIAMLAYAFLAIGAAHAVLMMAVERRLHGARGDTRRFGAPTGLPPLLTMEKLLFQMLGIGFVFLTLTVLSGIVFSEEIFGRAIMFDHKTVFGLIAWLIFAVLLLGRLAYGWRGRVALNWTFAGFGALMLAYVGSRFVLEVLLGRV